MPSASGKSVMQVQMAVPTTSSARGSGGRASGTPAIDTQFDEIGARRNNTATMAFASPALHPEVPRSDSLSSIPSAPPHSEYATVPPLGGTTSIYTAAPPYATIDPQYQSNQNQNQWQEGDAATPATLRTMPSNQYGAAPKMEDLI